MSILPRSRKLIGDNLSVIDGNIFFSKLQTLTVPVNLCGVMGKGLALHTKQKFPDVYVAYQDACRSKRVTEIKPYLYKREGSLDEELADFGADLTTPNAVKWFLLFATKRKWRENSRLEDIEGGLDWKDVGPLMCKYLHGIGIPVAIYLPRERTIPQEYLTASHLLAS